MTCPCRYFRISSKSSNPFHIPPWGFWSTSADFRNNPDVETSSSIFSAETCEKSRLTFSFDHVEYISFSRFQCFQKTLKINSHPFTKSYTPDLQKLHESNPHRLLSTATQTSAAEIKQDKGSNSGGLMQAADFKSEITHVNFQALRHR